MNLFNGKKTSPEMWAHLCGGHQVWTAICQPCNWCGKEDWALKMVRAVTVPNVAIIMERDK